MDLRPRSPHRDRGASLVGLLLVLIILGIMAAVAVSAVGGTRGSSLPTTPLTTTSAGESNNAAIEAALRVTCIADYETLSTALQVYATLHGTNPPAGTAWISGVQSGATLIESWPSDPGHFRFTWNGAELGVVPRSGTSSPRSMGAPGSHNGCFAKLF